MSNKNKVEILALIDRSGSMNSIMEEAVGAFNTFIEEQRKLELNDKVRVTLACFDNHYEVIYDRVPLDKVKTLTVEMVQPRGMTSLYDSVAKIILGAKYPKRNTVLLIQTDGYENTSKKFNQASVKAMIEAKEADGWDINFLGAGIDAVQEGAKFGIKAEKAYTVDATAHGMAQMSASMSEVSALYRTNLADVQENNEGS